MSAFELTTRTRRGDLGSPSMCTYGPLGRSASGLLPAFLLPVGGRGSWFSSAADFRFSASRTLAAALVVVGVGVGRDWPAFDAEAGWCPVSRSSGRMTSEKPWMLISSTADPWHFGTDPDPGLWLMDPDPVPDCAIFVINLQEANSELVFF